MNCSKCGSTLNIGDRFCTKCGMPISFPSKQENVTLYEKVCPKCGSAHSGEFRFCEVCGTDLVYSAELASQNIESIPLKATMGASHISSKAKKSVGRRLLVILGSLVVIGLIVFSIVAIMSKPVIDLNDYITVEFTGYDTLGNARVRFDFDRFYEDQEVQLGGSKGKRNGILDSLFSTSSEIARHEESESYRFLSQYISFQFDKESKLSNGDYVTLIWECDDDGVYEEYGVKLKYHELSYVVEGLDLVDSFDPFQFMSISFSGIAPYASLSIDVENYPDGIPRMRYSADKNRELDNGDVVTITAYFQYSDDEEKDLQYCIDYYGVIPNQRTTTIVVSGVYEYVSDYNQLTETFLNSCVENDSETMKNNYELDSVTYLGSYLMKKMEFNSYSIVNRLVMVYELSGSLTKYDTFANQNKTFKYTSYAYVTYSNIIIDENKEIGYDSASYMGSYQGSYVDTDIVKSTGWWTTYYSVFIHGYLSIEELRYSEVDSQLSNYVLVSDNVLLPGTTNSLYSDEDDKIQTSTEEETGSQDDGVGREQVELTTIPYSTNTNEDHSTGAFRSPSSDIASGDWIDVNGVERKNSLKFWVISSSNYCNSESITYDVSRYSTIEGEIVCGQISTGRCETGTVMFINIFLDDELVLTSDPISDNGNVYTYSLILDGHTNMTIECVTYENVFGECLLTATLTK